jgi:hypothetical protein
MSVVEADERQQFHPNVLSASLQLPPQAKGRGFFMNLALLCLAEPRKALHCPAPPHAALPH